MNDLFGLNARRKLPFAEYEKLFAQQRPLSLIGDLASSYSISKIKSRIDALDEIEQRKGFVFRGEKRWLQAYLANPSLLRYEQWIARSLQEVGVVFRHEEPSLWTSTIRSDSAIHAEALTNPNYTVDDELDIRVHGDQDGPKHTHLIALFDFLSSLEVFLIKLSEVHQSETLITVKALNITQPHDPTTWDLEFISEYGAEWDQSLPDSKIQM